MRERTTSREARALSLIEAIHGTVVLEERVANADRDALVIERFLATLESLVPNAPLLLHQIDSIRRWVRVLYRAPGYERFGGREHVQRHIIHILKRTRDTVEHYFGTAEAERRLLT